MSSVLTGLADIPVFLHYNEVNKVAPKNTKGETAIQTRPILQEIIKLIIIPIPKVAKASVRTEIVSVLSPLSFDTSADKVALKTPGALSLLSNH